MQTAEPSRLVDRLRLALALGREQRAAWPQHEHALAAYRRLPPCGSSEPPLLTIGFMTAPTNIERRQRIRAARDLLLTQGERCAVTLAFVLGDVTMFTAEERRLVQAERARHDDLVLLQAHDGAATSDASHGGRAVAEKAPAWFVHAANASRASFVAKVDDDSLVNLVRVVAELRTLMATAPHPERAYFGVHLYRLWNWARYASTPNAACGRHSDEGPPRRCEKLLTKMAKAAALGGECAGSLGPYPFLDGSFEVIGRGALVDIFGSARVRRFADDAFNKRRPPFWTHEDAGLGALVHREVVDRRLALTYVALRRWEHNRFWLNWNERSTLIDGDVLWAHYTRSAERSDYVAGAMVATATLPADGLACGSCITQWGWESPTPAAVCCSKPRPIGRGAPPPTLRAKFAPDRHLNLSCSALEEKGPASRYMLGILTRSHEADERYALRERLGTHVRSLQRHGEGLVRSCFVFDPTPPHGGQRKPGALFNTRAWLYFEAGRRADLDLTSLSPAGNFRAGAHDAARRWWRRTAAHARGPHGSAYYALTTAAELLVGPGGAGLARFTWVPQAEVAKRGR